MMSDERRDGNYPYYRQDQIDREDALYESARRSEPRNLANPDAQPALSEVLAKMKARSFYGEQIGRVVGIDDIEDVLSEYFA